MCIKYEKMCINAFILFQIPIQISCVQNPRCCGDLSESERDNSESVLIDVSFALIEVVMMHHTSGRLRAKLNCLGNPFNFLSFLLFLFSKIEANFTFLSYEQTGFLIRKVKIYDH